MLLKDVAKTCCCCKTCCCRTCCCGTYFAERVVAKCVVAKCVVAKRVIVVAEAAAYLGSLLAKESICVTYSTSHVTLPTRKLSQVQSDLNFGTT